MKLCVITFFITFFLENAKTWVGRTTLNGRKRGIALGDKEKLHHAHKRGSWTNKYLVKTGSSISSRSPTYDLRSSCYKLIWVVQGWVKKHGTHNRGRSEEPKFWFQTPPTKQRARPCAGLKMAVLVEGELYIFLENVLHFWCLIDG